MKILAFDTTMQACSVALLDTDRPTQDFVCYECVERGHAEILMPMILNVLEQAGCNFQDLDKIAVTLGPGAFTGVRVGIATARGLGLALEIPMSGYSSLHVIAQEAIENLVPKDGQLIVAHDARRGEIYLQRFDHAGNPLGEPEVAKPDEVLIEDRPAVIVGSAGKMLDHLTGDMVSLEMQDILPNARFLSRLALRQVGVIHKISPLYLRQPDAKPQTGKHITRVHDTVD